MPLGTEEVPAECATDKGDRVGDQVVKDSKGLVARLEECADQGIRCAGDTRSVYCSLTSSTTRREVRPEFDSPETMMPQIPATSKSRSRSRYELLGNPTLLQCDSSDAAIAMTTMDVRRVMSATGAMVIRMRRSATVERISS